MKTPKNHHMVKKLTTAFSIVLSIVTMAPASAQKRGHASGTTASKPALKFLEAIEISTGEEPSELASKTTPLETTPKVAVTPVVDNTSFESNAIESASALQLKYAVLLNTEVERIQNAVLFGVIDEWYGTKYRLGGSTKEGIDCSAFVQVVFSNLFQITMPRTAKEQFEATRPIATAELKEGDLVFFNIKGSGVSHVGVYLQNNKFVHAATSGGVMISDLSEPYWEKHFLSAGRNDNMCETQATLAAKP
jgi:lipoprotein Spr